MKRAVLLATLALGCGGAATPAPVQRLAPPKRIVTLEERRAAACGGGLASPAAIVESAEPPEERRVVRSVSVRDPADRAVEDDRLRDLPVRVGEPYDAARGHDAVRRIWATGTYSDVVIDSKPEGDGIAVVFRVTPRAAIDQVFVAGASEDDLRGLHARPGAAYEPGALFSGVRAIEGSYHERGYLDAKLRIGSANAPDDPSRVDVCVTAAIGSLVTIGAIDFEGTTHEAELRGLLTSEDGKNVPGGLLDRELFDRDVLYMSAKYYDLGYLTHTLSYRTERKGDQLRVVFQVVEGAVYRIGKLEIKGDLAAPRAAYERLFSLKRGDIFDRSKLIADMDAMRALDKGTGRKEIELEPLTHIDEGKHTVDVTLELHDPDKAATASHPTPPAATATGLQLVDLAVGHGAQARPGDRVTVHYTGSLPNGTVFDSSRQHGTPFVFVLGGGQVIKGFDQGVAGMRVGGKRRVTIPPDLGYGDRGAPPSIPPQATLILEIELMKVGP